MTKSFESALKELLKELLPIFKYVFAFLGWFYFIIFFWLAANDSVFFITNDEELIEVFRQVNVTKGFIIQFDPSRK